MKKFIHPRQDIIKRISVKASISVGTYMLRILGKAAVHGAKIKNRKSHLSAEDADLKMSPAGLQLSALQSPLLYKQDYKMD